ncbi:acyl carrier protein [Polaribacter sp. Z014]|uniref:acyl carrier protein n=1 Tax=Polaribacter sp. Z014 TaxID=2927126 RepID=UPI0020229341|nr:acyl carrier protein [Polaribacter sp. Z014]MCL7763650.1 acyl carrier protein [Polaribacter sp. Z014]
MNKNKITQEVEAIFKKVFEDDKLEINMTMTANDVDNWDSLSHMLLIVEVENTFNIKFKLRDLNKMKNVGDMIDLLVLKTE